jgi:phenylalanyl-tRNA synthetase beta subunit
VLYQSDERTLTDDDVAKAQRKIVERLRRDLNAELRG